MPDAALTPAPKHSSLILVASAGLPDDPYVNILKEAGYPVISLTDASAAAVEASRPLPDLIIARLRRERADGVLLCRALRSSAAIRGVPLVVITPWDDLQTREQILRAGATAISVEPLPRGLLLRQVRRVLARAANRRQLAPQLEAAVP